MLLAGVNGVGVTNADDFMYKNSPVFMLNTRYFKIIKHYSN